MAALLIGPLKKFLCTFSNNLMMSIPFDSLIEAKMEKFVEELNPLTDQDFEEIFSEFDECLNGKANTNEKKGGMKRTLKKKLNKLYRRKRNKTKVRK